MKNTTNKFLMILIIGLIFINKDSVAQQLEDKVYWMSTMEIPLAKLSEFHTFNMQELTPLMEEHGYKSIVTWQTIVGDIEEVIYVSEFENMTAYHKARKSLLGSDEWKIAGKKFGNLNKSIKTRFLSATPNSKLK